MSTPSTKAPTWGTWLAAVLAFSSLVACGGDDTSGAGGGDASSDGGGAVADGGGGGGGGAGDTGTGGADSATRSDTGGGADAATSDDAATDGALDGGDTEAADAAILPTSFYVYDRFGQLAGEYDSNGNPILEVVYVEKTPIAALAASSIYSVHADQVDAPRALADATGKTVWSWDSDPFGATAPNEDPDGDGVRVTFPLRFAGQYFDRETGLHHNGLRDYDPTSGRYVESDPIGMAGGPNPYLYVGASPLRFTDRLGTNADPPPFPTDFQVEPMSSSGRKAYCDALKRLAQYEASRGGKGAYANGVLNWFDGAWPPLTVGDGNAVPAGVYLGGETIAGYDFNYFETAYAGAAQGTSAFGLLGNVAYTGIGLVLHVGAYAASSALGSAGVNVSWGGLSPNAAILNAIENINGTLAGIEAARFPSIEAYRRSVCETDCPR